MHIVQRGHDRRECFRSDDDFRRYQRLLRESAQRHSCAVHAYVLMTPLDARAAARMMHRVAGMYAYWFNSSYTRSGTLWEGRYWSCLIESERHLFACSRYLELNPVRAGMVIHPREYRWSSYRANAECATDPLLTPHSLYSSLGTTGSERAANYASLFAVVIDPGVVDAIRRRPGRRP
jgi:putative transposase